MEEISEIKLSFRYVSFRLICVNTLTPLKGFNELGIRNEETRPDSRSRSPRFEWKIYLNGVNRLRIVRILIWKMFEIALKRILVNKLR